MFLGSLHALISTCVTYTEADASLRGGEKDRIEKEAQKKVVSLQKTKR